MAPEIRPSIKEHAELFATVAHRMPNDSEVRLNRYTGAELAVIRREIEGDARGT